LLGVLFLDMILENFGKLDLRFYVVLAKIVYHNYIPVGVYKLIII